MKRYFIIAILFLLLAPFSTFADPIAADRQIDWQAGVSGGIPTYTGTTRDVTDAPYNATGDGSTDDASAIQAAIDASAAGDIVYLPAGTFRIASMLVEYQGRGILIKGAGIDNTELKVDFSTAHSAAISAHNSRSYGSAVAITDDPITKGTTTLKITNGLLEE